MPSDVRSIGNSLKTTPSEFYNWERQKLNAIFALHRRSVAIIEQTSSDVFDYYRKARDGFMVSVSPRVTFEKWREIESMYV